MNVSERTLREDLRKTHQEITNQINSIKVEADHLNISAHDLRDSRGNWVMAPLLAAKAQTLHALSLLQRGT